MLTTANSTPTGLPQDNLSYSSASNGFNLQNLPLMTPNPATYQPATPTTTAPTNPVAQTAPTNPVVTTPVIPKNSAQADSIYTKAMIDAASSSAPVKSDVMTSSNNLPNANATRSTMESMYQDYLNSQKSLQQRLLEQLTPSQQEAELQRQLAQQKAQAQMNQEKALNSGETMAFAGGEAQRIARNDALQIASTAAQIEALGSQRANAEKILSALIQSGDNSFKTQVEMAKATNTLGNIDKQAQDTAFNIIQSTPGLGVQYDYSKTPLQNLDIIQKARDAMPSELSAANRQTRINSIVNEFNNEPSVKNYQTVAEGYQFAQNLANKINNKEKLTSADNIGLLYAFAKAMDPGSVVREGEYATIQKYSQSWAESFGLNVNRILKNEAFMTDGAVKNLISVMDAKYKSSEQNYQNIYGSYKNKINQAESGQVGGTVTDYSKGFNIQSPNQPVQGATVKTKIGEIRTDW